MQAIRVTTMSRSSDPHDPLSRLTENLAGHLESALEGAEGGELCFALFVFDGNRMFHAANVDDADLQAALAEYLAARAN